MLTNGCYQSSNETECNSVVNGLFAKGLHLALQYFIQSVNTVLMARHEGSYWNMSVSVSARVTWNVFGRQFCSSSEPSIGKVSNDLDVST